MAKKTKTTTTTTKPTRRGGPTRPIKLNQHERRTLECMARASDARATLDDLIGAHKRAAAAQRTERWHYATKVEKSDRLRFKASLLARNSIRKPCSRGLARKIKPGLYEITAAGRKALNA